MDCKKFVENSRKWLSQYIQDNHLQSLVIGISGGIDSTVSCAIASPVCKELNIPLIGRSLPSITNKPDENYIAKLVGSTFCDDFKVVNISEICQKLIYEITMEEGVITTLQEGNIKARTRMIYLRHLASLYKGVVIDNDNFSEWNLGFWTVGGDSPMDINLGLHYLWKTEVYELAHYLFDSYLIRRDNIILPSKECDAILQSISLVPTDGNGVSNSDCEQFSLENYEQVDDILKTMYFPENGMDNIKYKEEYIRLIDTYNEQGVDKVMTLHQNTGYKRKELPIKPTKKELGL